MLKRQFCRNVEHYYVREYWSEEYAERGNYHGYFPFNEPCTVLWWKGLLLSPCRERQIEKAQTFSPHLVFGCSCLVAKSRTLCPPRSGKEGELGWRVMLAARAGSAVTRGGWKQRVEGPRAGLSIPVHGGTRGGFLVSSQNESWGQPGLCSGAGRRSPPRAGVRAVSAQHPCSVLRFKATHLAS